MGLTGSHQRLEETQGSQFEYQSNSQAKKWSSMQRNLRDGIPQGAIQYRPIVVVGYFQGSPNFDSHLLSLSYTVQIFEPTPIDPRSTQAQQFCLMLPGQATLAYTKKLLNQGQPLGLARNFITKLFSYTIHFMFRLKVKIHFNKENQYRSTSTRDLLVGTRVQKENTKHQAEFRPTTSKF